jgi:hypothetical protein
MFTAKRYATRGIATEIGLDTQMILWAMIDNRKKKGIKVDYLQVFELSIARKEGVLVQKVLHKQEYPPVSDSYYLPKIERPMRITIWVMDNEEYCKMILPDEY